MSRRERAGKTALVAFFKYYPLAAMQGQEATSLAIGARLFNHLESSDVSYSLPGTPRMNMNNKLRNFDIWLRFAFWRLISCRLRSMFGAVGFAIGLSFFNSHAYAQTAFGLAGIRSGMNIDELTASLKLSGLSITEANRGVSYKTLFVDATTGNQIEAYFSLGNTGLSRILLLTRGENSLVQSRAWTEALRQNYGRPSRSTVDGQITYCITSTMEISTSISKPRDTSAGLSFMVYPSPSENCSRNASPNMLGAPAYAFSENQKALFGQAKPLSETAVAAIERSQEDPKLEAAKRGDALAQLHIGLSNLRSKTYENALYWLRKSAAQGNGQAMNSLAQMYVNGWGVRSDYSQAEPLYQKAAELGVREAMYNLGELYRVGGDGITKNRDISVKWFRRAAALGDADATHNIEVNDRERHEELFALQAEQRRKQFSTPDVKRCIKIGVNVIRDGGFREETAAEMQARNAAPFSVGQTIIVPRVTQNFVHNICDKPVTAYFECKLIKGGATPFALAPGRRYINELPGDRIYGVEGDIYRNSIAPDPTLCQ